MAQGIPTDKQYSTSDITDAIIKHCGVIAHAAYELGLNKDTLYVYINRYPELWDLINEQRKKGSSYTRAWLADRALRGIQKIMEKADTHPSSALKACTYIMDNMDDFHGCKKKSSEYEHNESDVKLDEFFKFVEEYRDNNKV
jgi:hypothetical protein